MQDAIDVLDGKPYLEELAGAFGLLASSGVYHGLAVAPKLITRRELNQCVAALRYVG